MIYDGIIIGGGAAGLFAAGTLTKGKYLLLEGEPQVGNKIMISGAGQCNFTFAEYPNAMMHHYGDHGKHIKQLLKAMSYKQLIAEFEKFGVAASIREDGKVFPASFEAKDIVRALLARINKDIVSIKTKTRVKDVKKTEDGFDVHTKDTTYSAKNVLFATGGGSFRRTGSDGHGLEMLSRVGVTTQPFRPALVPVSVSAFTLGELAGVSLSDISIRFDGREAKGDVLVTSKGFSGPVIINNSRYFLDGMIIAMNFTACSFKEMDAKLLGIIQDKGSESVRFMVNQLPYPQRLMRLLWKDYLDLNLGQITKEIRRQMVKQICDLECEIKCFPIDQGMATAGGVSVEHINFKTMASKEIAGLYVAGEVTDIDGDTGGYNIHYAFTSGYLAAKSMDVNK